MRNKIICQRKKDLVKISQDQVFFLEGRTIFYKFDAGKPRPLVGEIIDSSK